MRRIYAFLALCVATTAVAMSNAPRTGASPGAVAVSCSVTGAKYFATPMTSAAICDRFVAAIRAATKPRTGKARADAVTAELVFKPPGLASARAVHMRDGQRHMLPLYEIAVSDRKFLITDVDKLASEVARGMTAPAPAGRS